MSQADCVGLKALLVLTLALDVVPHQFLASPVPTVPPPPQFQFGSHPRTLTPGFAQAIQQSGHLKIITHRDKLILQLVKIKVASTHENPRLESTK